MTLNQKKTSAIGVMSGTSLDGLDLAYCTFEYDEKWHFELLETTYIAYDTTWKNKLASAHLLSAEKLAALDAEFGIFIGNEINRFLTKTEQAKPDLVCSHGHTVFHNPSKHFTVQIGSGAHICATTETNTVSDFRSLDISLGGEGAPLVPIGDALLFPEYDGCLNLGGFSNISFNDKGKRIAYDICPVNMALNHLSKLLGQEFDEGGNLAQLGSVNSNLLAALNRLDVYNAPTKTSLAREWFEQQFVPAIENSDISIHDKLRTVIEHIAIQISNETNRNMNNGRLLITGGGTKNTLLVNRINQLANVEVVIPSSNIIDFKEALIFAFLGVLRINGINNVLSSVTGAKRDSCSGTVHLSIF
ncbi:anhydro-N-acetylmuramic acid kinase [Bacteroidota bacterium]